MKMNSSNIIRKVLSILLMAFLVSCGVDGDPGHCYMTIEWEYYNEGYGVSYYEDDNESIPAWEELENGVEYDCYPGEYTYFYTSEDSSCYYSYSGVYTLVQNPGYSGSLLKDGLDGVDTRFTLKLPVYALDSVEQLNACDSLKVSGFKLTKGRWTLNISEKASIIAKKSVNNLK